MKGRLWAAALRVLPGRPAAVSPHPRPGGVGLWNWCAAEASYTPHAPDDGGLLCLSCKTTTEEIRHG